MPLPGAEVKLVPAEEGGYEIRVKGPNVTPGYVARPDLTGQAFDGDGFYRAGDAVALADAGDLNAGLVFRGRIAEDFKLATGTFVRVGAVRIALLSAIPVLADAVLTGRERDLAEHNDAAGSSARIQRLVVLARPASLDDGEITDKGYINQRKVLSSRAAPADLLYADPAPPGVITAETWPLPRPNWPRG